jgi:hypothetical protein
LSGLTGNRSSTDRAARVKRLKTAVAERRQEQAQRAVGKKVTRVEMRVQRSGRKA